MATGEQEIFERIDFAGGADPVRGTVRWAPDKSLWWTGHVLAWAVLGTLFFSWGAVAAFLVLSAGTLCFGHSLGMHRKLIHNSFACSRPLEDVLVYLGTLVGIGGPSAMMETHDIRDWAQRQPRCHPFLSHGTSLARDFLWQLHCRLHLERPPVYRAPERVAGSRFMRTLDRTWMWQQVPVGIALFALGGWGFVAWGVCGRVAVSVWGHWIIGWFAHNRGHRSWRVEGAAVQGHNVRGFGWITFGECWHNNHHAFPGSANLGLERDQSDPGWWMLKAGERLGLVWDLALPADLEPRPELRAEPASRSASLDRQVLVP